MGISNNIENIYSIFKPLMLVNLLFTLLIAKICPHLSKGKRLKL
jgi:hypothetical protein